MNAPYTFVTLRYVHDIVTGEFVNVGVVLYSPSERYLAARFTTSFERLNALFVKVDRTNLNGLLRFMTERFDALSLQTRDGLNLNVSGLDNLVRSVLPQDDSAIQWSTQGGGLTADLDKTFNDLYFRMVEKYVRKSATASRSDEDIIRPFKARLKKSALVLQDKIIEAKDYQYHFECAWKNSIWHVYEPLSLDLADPNKILDKANLWVGRGAALESSQDQFMIHFLVGKPMQPGTAEAFEHAKHLLNNIPVNKELISEELVVSFADEVAAEIESHTEESE